MRILLLVLVLAACADPATESDTHTPDQPNILLLVADDLGYADLGCYGGDIETPNIDALALRGVRFSRFHTSPFCAPTRAMLLSGNDNHIAGMGRQGLVTPHFGYEGHLTDRIATIPQVLRTAGYHTYMAGKWHLGERPEDNPAQKGFERSFVVLHGAANHYDDQGLFPNNPTSQYTEDGAPVQWPEGAYSTDHYTDKLIEYIDDNADDGKPFFAFATYTSPHWPLQVDEAHWKKYAGRYDDGYEALKEKRLATLKEAGMVPPDAQLPPNHARVKAWASLSDDEKGWEARKMELYAGMVDNLDHNIGRLLQHLKDIGQYDNTLVVVMSDNGAAAEDFYYHGRVGPFLRQHFTDAYDVMGLPHSYISYGPQWAEAGSAPFRYFKGQTTQGGVTAPMIMAGPGVSPENKIYPHFATLTDLAPTFYDLAGAAYPDSMHGRTLYPLIGTSLRPMMSGDEIPVHDSTYTWALEHGNRSLLIQGDWKLTNNSSPFDSTAFGLYNIKNDPGEFDDMSEQRPEKFSELRAAWDAHMEYIQAQFPPPSPGGD